MRHPTMARPEKKLNLEILALSRFIVMYLTMGNQDEKVNLERTPRQQSSEITFADLQVMMHS